VLDTRTFDRQVNGGSYQYVPGQAGGPGSMEFPAMHHIAADCAAILKVTGKAYTESVPFTCYPSVVARSAKRR
jgi:hypothetical protein